MPETITIPLGDVTVPISVVQELLRRHLLRSLRLSSNGHSPSPSLEPQEEPAPAVPPLDGSPVPAPAGAP